MCAQVCPRTHSFLGPAIKLPVKIAVLDSSSKKPPELFFLICRHFHGTGLLPEAEGLLLLLVRTCRDREATTQ